ncbi:MULTISPECIES: MCE family protein [unclassified Mycolicibacterium]|uniref:MCE family protein n=1 Tax=unclassified Mycolicibacterium TaxID=2636767 RepID=UPI001606F953|nr:MULTISPECIES: MCE family protein [unclassified Mycolicibacterium]MBB3630167.1 virulence factor Mce-like protein [Mycolicibacterium sp. BK607]
MRRKRIATGAAAVLVVVLLAAAAILVHHVFFAPKTISAYFVTTTAIYPGDEVRVSGVRVGTVDALAPEVSQTKLTMSVDRNVTIPADAKAVIVAQNLVAARYVELTPAYHHSGPAMADGTIIPIDRTAVPVEWDEVKAQLSRLATDLGPASEVSSTSVGRFIDSAANALDGNGDALRQTLAQLAGVGRILANGSGNIVDTIKNLQAFVTALRDSQTQIVAFQNNFATLTSVLNESTSNLDLALRNLSSAIADVQRFVAGSRNQTSEQIQRLANVTQILVDNKMAFENLLHATPNALANGYNIYNPDTGTTLGGFTLANFSNPVGFICGAIGGVANVTAPEANKLCAQYLGPALRLLNFNYLPIPTNPYLAKSATPDNIIYTDPALAPGANGPVRPPEPAPPVSAYTGEGGDVAAPPGLGQPPAVAPGPTAPGVPGAPSYPSPALFPGAPVPTVSGLPDMLLPAESPQSAPPSPGGPP